MKKNKTAILKKNISKIINTSLLLALILFTNQFSFGQEWQQVGQNICEENSYTSSTCINENGNILAKAYYNVSDSLIVKVYKKSGFGEWVQEGNTINIENTTYENVSTLSLDSSGNTLAIGCFTQSNENIKIFKNITENWVNIENIDSQNMYDGSHSISIKLSFDGNTLAFGTGSTSSSTSYGKVKVYSALNNWEQIGEDIIGEMFGDQSGCSIDLSSDGSFLAIGAFGNDDAATNAGHVRIFQNIDQEWIQMGNDIDGQTDGEFSGYTISLSNDGNRIAISANFDKYYPENTVHARIYEFQDGYWQQIGNDIIEGGVNLLACDLSGDGTTLMTSILDSCYSFYLHGTTNIYKENLGNWTLMNTIQGCIIKGNSVNFDGTKVVVETNKFTQVFQVCETPISVSLNDIQNADCGFQNGSASSIATGGTPPYTYYWSNGDTLDFTDSLLIGNNSVKAIDTEGCYVKENFTIGANDTPVITLNNQTNLTCYNGNTGTIDISLSGNIESIAWSNGAETEDIFGLSAGTYDVTVTSGSGCSTSEAFTLPEISEMNIEIDITDATCGLADGSAIINSITGGTAPYEYIWSVEDNTSLAAGNYSLTVIDANNCTKIKSFNISNLGAPSIIVDEIAPVQCGETGQILISVTGASGAQTYDWSSDGLGDADDTEDLLAVSSGDFTLIVEDEGCLNIIDLTIPSLLPNTPEICMVTVDTLVNHNLVVWENESSSTISHYNIYRETSSPDAYQWIGEVQYDALSEFEDPTANPSAGSSRYKISAVDNCDNESELSTDHKSFYLQILSGYLGSYDLEWENYEGINSGVFIKRYLNSTGWVILDSLSINANNFTDLPPNTVGLKYIVTRAGINCTPSNNNRSTGGPYTQAVSNLEEDDYEIFLPTVIENIEKFNPSVKIYPNPALNYLQVESPSAEIETIEVLDITGKLIKQFKIKSPEYLINVEDLPKGIYIINIGTSISQSSHKMIKE